MFSSTYGQVKRLYIADDNHTDYMWTTTEATYDSAFVHMLDYYLDQVDVTKNNPDNLQARFNCDGSYWLKVYEKYRTPEQFKRLVTAIRSKHISSPLTSLANTYGAQPTEAVIRGMFDAGRLERKLGLRFRMAVCMEDQTLPLGLSALWAGSGAKYSWKGICGCDTKMPATGFGKRRNQLYYYTGLDGSKIIMKWYNMGINNAFLGGYAEARGEYKPRDTLESIKAAIRGLDSLCIPTKVNNSYPYKIAGAFGYGWDDLETYVSPAFINAAKLMTNDSVKIRVSNEEDFFEDVEKTYPHLPAESVTYGNEWDTYCASMNETTAKVRRAVEKLRNAEALAAVVWLKNKKMYHSLASLREKAWEGYGLYWEHDWTSDGPVSKSDRARWQIKIQEQITVYSDSLLEKSKTELGRQLGNAKFPRFYVFNSLGWVRSDVADIPFAPNYPFDVIDLSTNKKTNSQQVTFHNASFLRIYAENIPSVGYKIFEIRPTEKKSDDADAAAFSNDYFMNRFYRIRLSRSGAINEIYDSIASRQLVKPVNGKFVNDIDGSHNDGDALQIENAGPVSVTLKAVSDGELRRVVRVTLFAHTPRIDIDDSIQSNFEVLQTWSFSFGLEKPVTHHEELGSVLTLRKENNGGHYASQNARYDWNTFNHFADLSEENYGITISNRDCSFFRLGSSTVDSLDEYASQLHALAGGQTDKYITSPTGKTDTVNIGIIAQNGQKDFNYQFSLTTHQRAFDDVEAMKFALTHQNPLVAGIISGGKNADSKNAFSLLRINDDRILLWSVKPSEDNGQALITRFWNFQNKERKPVISMHMNIEKAWTTSHIETKESGMSSAKNKLRPLFRPFQIRTFQLDAKP